jgi:subtilisin-like proprotein convertase family protein
VFEFAFEGAPSLEEIDGGTTVRLEGEQTWVSAGDPVMPVRESSILLPQGTEITSVEARYLDAGIVIGRGVPLLAAPAAVPFGAHVASDRAPAFVRSSFGQEEAVAYSNHTICGYSVGTLSIFPVEYDAVADTLIYHSEISAEVTAGPVQADGAVATRPSEADRGRVAQLVENPEMIGLYTSSEPTSPEPASSGGSPMLPASGQYEYVIITNGALEASFQPLVSQKLGRGLSATVVTTESIYANYSGTETGDHADQIREFIADAYANWGTQWVLLGGDADVVPHRGVYASVGSTVDKNLPTDLYYACLDGPWNHDGDNRWGESSDGRHGGDIDLMPEVYIGRAPASTAAEAANFVAKTIRYETTAHAHAATAVWLGEKLDEETWGSYSAIPIRDQCLPEDWDLIERYDSAGGWSGSQFAGDLQDGPHLVNHLGHANETYNARLGKPNVDDLTNADPYFMYSQGCMSGSFDTHNNAIAEKHVVADYGAFGVVMNSRYGWYVPGDFPGASHYYALEFWDAVFNEDLIHVGQANHDSKVDNLFRVRDSGAYRWIHFETNLFGDPETPFQIGEAPLPGAEIHGTVVDDANADGQHQPGEGLLAGETVFLDLNDNGVLDLGATSAASTDVPVDVLDNATVTSTLVVRDAAAISDVNVTLDITHTYDADLEVYLVSPTGTRVELFTRVGGWGADFTGTTLDEEAATSIADGAAPFSGTFRPEGLLSSFDGEDPNGTWTLEITDTMTADVGTLNAWSLEIAADEPYAESGPDGTYAFQDLPGGTYHIRHALGSGWTHTNPADGAHVVSVQQGEVAQGVDFLAFEVPEAPPATELGEIDFLEIADLNLADADYWYRCQTVREGYLTVAAIPEQAGGLEIRLYSADRSELATSVPCEGAERIDWTAGAGQTFYFSVTGHVADVDLRLANLVNHEGPSVFVYGTDADDRLDFAAAEWHQVTINGVHYEFDAQAATSLEFDGGAGDDVAVLMGTAAAETAVLHPSWAALTGADYQVAVANTPNIIIMGEGGDDVAHLYDSPGDDELVGSTTHARLYGHGFYNQVFDFCYVCAYSTTGGTDLARLYDSAGDDTLVATPDYAKLYGDGFYHWAEGFDYVLAYATSGGTDLARLYDSAGDDTLVATPEYAKLYGDGFYDRVEGFDYVLAYATSGGTDLARLYDSAGDDTLVATPDYAKLYGDGFYNGAEAFRYVCAYATAGGTDVARLYDSAGDDTLVATPDYAKLYGDAFYNGAKTFDYVHAYATLGGDDRAMLYDSPGDDVFAWTPDYAKAYGDAFYYRAVSFRQVDAYAGAGGQDRAYLCDSAGDDRLEASAGTAALIASGMSAWANDFAWVTAISSEGGADTKHVESIDFLLETQGSWTDL